MRDSICGADFICRNRGSISDQKGIWYIETYCNHTGYIFAGAVFCMSCDLIARMALAPVELNISTVTSIVGAPIVIYMMVKREKGR